MNLVQILLIGGGVISFLLLVTLGVLFFVSRRTQKTMESLLQIMIRPERAKIQDAVRVLNTILADEIAKIESGFQTMRDTLNAQIASAVELKQQLTEQNDNLVSTADEATKKLALMSQRLDNTLSGLQGVVESTSWSNIQSTTENFSNTVNELLSKIDVTSQDTTDKILHIREQIDNWIESGKALSEALQNEYTKNTEQKQQLTTEAQELQTKLTDLAQSTATEFNKVKEASSEYEKTLTNNNKLMEGHLNKLDSFTKQSKKQLDAQTSKLTITSNAIGAQIRLAESSMKKQIGMVSSFVESLSDTSVSTENTVRQISTELASLTNRFNGEVKELATGVVSEIKTVSRVANDTLENTRVTASEFTKSVTGMATDVRETLMKMNAAHTQLAGQSAHLIKLSKETTAQLQPLSELIEKYHATLPDLSRGSVETSDNLNRIVEGLNEKINLLKTTVAESTGNISQSAIKLDELAGQSRQQMIDLMSDYAKAVDTMQTLNKQMMVARASAPMDAIKTAPGQTFGAISTDDFLKQSERLFEKLHEQSMDLVRTSGANIPDAVWKKYHAGDKAIFSKWLAKMLGAADKKRVREMIKGNAAFASQATQLVRSFDKLMNTTRSADGSDKLAATLIKTDLGQIYMVLKAQL